MRKSYDKLPICIDKHRMQGDDTMATLHEEISRRRTFAIISHPDAGPELALELEEKGYDWIKKEMGEE